MEHAFMCPQCNAPLSPNPFARSTVCAYCGATVQLDGSTVPVATFQKAYQNWNAPQPSSPTEMFSIGETHWGLEKLLGQGETSDVYKGRRLRWPTELVVVKRLRPDHDAALLEREWSNLQNLHRLDTQGASTFTTLLPQLVAHDQRASVFRWERGFHYNLEQVRAAYPQGIPPRASIWVWRRILEVLLFLHNAGIVHGAVLPEHLLIQENEHGLRLVSYGRTGIVGDRLQQVPSGQEAFYPTGPSGLTLTKQLDLILSARCIVFALRNDPQADSLPAEVPPPLADLLRRIVQMNPQRESNVNAWSIREELGEIATKVYGPPQFVPLNMPA